MAGSPDLKLLRGTGDLAPHLETIVDIYREAFGAPPYREGEAEVAGFRRSITAHAGRLGFHCWLVRTDGFAYGYSGLPGGWWWDTVAGAIGPEAVDRWLRGCFEVVALAVRPAAQGAGIGRQLHAALVSGLPHRTAALSTLDADTRARRLFERSGWITVRDAFRFRPDGAAFRIMARDLT